MQNVGSRPACMQPLHPLTNSNIISAPFLPVLCFFHASCTSGPAKPQSKGSARACCQRMQEERRSAGVVPRVWFGVRGMLGVGFVVGGMGTGESIVDGGELRFCFLGSYEK